MRLFDVSSDSTCDLKKDYVKNREIWFAPLTFTMEKEGEIQEYEDDFSDYKEYLAFYQKIREGYFPRTAKLNYEAHLRHFTAMAEAGVKECVHFTISSGLANTITITQKAAKEVEKLYPNFKVYAVDPLTATVGQGLLTSLACDCRDGGMSAEETFSLINELKNNVQHCIIPNDLFYLKKGGRVSGASAVLGTVLNVKPMLVFDEEGKLKVVEKCKGMKKAFARVAECLAFAPLDGRKKLIVVHTDNEKGAEELAKLLKDKFDYEAEITVMGPVIGSHVGPGSVSCCWLSVKSRKEVLETF